MHVHLLPYDYYADRPSSEVGLAQTAALLEKMRPEVKNALVFDNGDFLQGTPLSDFIAHESGFGRGDLHPVIAAMNRIGYDAATLGNHEFNYGLPFLLDVLDPAAFPVVSANVLTARGETPREDQTFLPPWTILSKDVVMEDGGTERLKVGVIGFAPPQISSWDRSHLEGQIVTRDIVEAAEAQVPALKAAGADIVVALCHSGIGSPHHIPGMENAAVPLAALPGIDVLMTGHTHMVFPGEHFSETAVVDPITGTLHGKPTVMAGFFGSHLGVIDLVLNKGEAGWRIAGHHVRAEPIVHRRAATAPPEPRVEPDLRVIETAEELHETTLDFLRKPLGTVTGPITSYFVLTSPNPTLRLVADAQRRFAASLLAGGPHEGEPLISAVAPFKAGGWGGPYNYVDIPPGPLAMRNAAELYLFPNTLCAIELTGAQAMDWLERSAGLFLQISRGATAAPLINTQFAAYNYDVLDGLTYRIDLTRPPRYGPGGEIIDMANTRVVEVGYRGRPLDPNEKLIVVTNSYRAGGGGMFRAASEGRIVFSTALSSRDVLIDHIRSLGTIRPDVRTSWEFVPMPGTTALFESGPGALPHMPPRFDHVGALESGFEQFELSL